MSSSPLGDCFEQINISIIDAIVRRGKSGAQKKEFMAFVARIRRGHRNRYIDLVNAQASQTTEELKAKKQCRILLKNFCDESQSEIHAGVSLTAAAEQEEVNGQINDVNDIFNPSSISLDSVSGQKGIDRENGKRNSQESVN